MIIIIESFLDVCIHKKATRNYKLMSTQRQSKDGAMNKYFIVRLPSLFWVNVSLLCKIQFLLKSENSRTASNTRKVRTVTSLTTIFVY